MEAHHKIGPMMYERNCLSDIVSDLSDIVSDVETICQGAGRTDHARSHKFTHSFPSSHTSAAKFWRLV